MNEATYNNEPETIIHADDFGITEEQSLRILDCASSAGKGGVLNSLSILVTSPAFRDCVALLKRADGVRVGLHVNLVEGPCAADAKDIPLLANEEGVFKSGFGGLLLTSVAHPSESRRQIACEIGAQIDLFLSEFPELREKMRVDSHQHFHMIPAVYDALWQALDSRECAVEYMRIPAEPLTPFVRARALTKVPPINWVKHVVLNGLWRINKGKRKVNTAVFCGINYSGVMTADRVGRVAKEFILYAAKKGAAVEFLFHPGGMEKAEKCLNPDLKGFVEFYLSPNRKLEAQAIKSLRL